MDNKLRLIKDLIVICKLNDEDLSTRTRKEIIKGIISWHYTDRDDDDNNAKIKGCPYWSEAALEKYEQLLEEKKRKKGFKLNLDSHFRHEHIIPRNIFAEAIFANELEKRFKYNEEDIKEELDERLIGCVVTKKEADLMDKSYKTSMPDSDSGKSFFEIKDPWARYKKEYTDSNGKKIKIKVYNVEWTRNAQSNRWIGYEVKERQC